MLRFVKIHSNNSPSSAILKSVGKNNVWESAINRRDKSRIRSNHREQIGVVFVIIPQPQENSIASKNDYDYDNDYHSNTDFQPVV